MTPRIRTYHELGDPDRSGLGTQVAGQRERVAQRLLSVGNVVAVMSGKGGVGKSFVTAALAKALAKAGRRVGVLDADLHGPTAARMLGVAGGQLVVRDDAVEPALGADGVRVMSTDLILPEGAPLKWKEPEHEGFIWRGALEAGMLREFLSDVAWGDLDLLLVDLPPGTDRLNALRELLPDLAGVLVVTIPSDESRRAVARAIEAARAGGIDILGIVENMAGYQCPDCGVVKPLFAGKAAEELSADSGSPVLASIPFSPDAVATAAVVAGLAASLIARLEQR